MSSASTSRKEKARKNDNFALSPFRPFALSLLSYLHIFPNGQIRSPSLPPYLSLSPSTPSSTTTTKPSPTPHQTHPLPTSLSPIPQTALSPPFQNPPKKKMVKRNIVIAIIVILLFLILAIVGYIIYAIQNQVFGRSPVSDEED